MHTKKDSISVLHVLFTSLPFFNKGYNIRSHYILKAQKKLGIEAFALTGPCASYQIDKDIDKDIIDDITYYRTPNHKLLNWLIYNIPNTGGMVLFQYFFKKRLYELIDPLKPKVIHAHTPWLTAIPAMKVAREKGIRFVYEVRGIWEESAEAEKPWYQTSKRYQRIRENENYVISRADRVVVISEGIKREILDRGVVKEENIWVVPNGVDITRFKPMPGDSTLINKLGLNDKAVIGYISSLRKMEGISYLIEAMQFVDKKASLIIVGDGPEEESLRGKVKELRLSDRVMLVGRVPHEEILKYYSIIDVFVVPRINAKVCHIVTPLKPLEAMAMGKCILASRVGGLSEMIIDGETGLMFEPENIKDLSEKINYLLENKDFRNQLGENALKFVEKERSWEIVCRKYFEVYTR